MDKRKKSHEPIANPQLLNVKRIKLEVGESDSSESESNKVVAAIVEEEFHNEISEKKNEIDEIQDKLIKAQKTLHLLKYVVVKAFYESKDLQLPLSDSETGVDPLYKRQKRPHPSVKLALNQKPNEKTYQIKEPSKAPESQTISLEYPIELESAPDLELEWDTTTQKCIRSRHKYKFRVIVGNISKWMPSENPKDKSTHKWMAYVRGPQDNPEISHFVKKVRFFLHPSYRPNDIVDIASSPFHLSRRGWGEFPLRAQLHFQCAENKPVDIIHNLKLDKTYTGLQTLGSETIVDLWLFANLEEKDEVEEIDEPHLDLCLESVVEPPEVDLSPKVLFDHDYCQLNGALAESNSHSPKKGFDPNGINYSVCDNGFLDESTINLPPSKSIVHLKNGSTAPQCEERKVNPEKYQITFDAKIFSSVPQALFYLLKRLPLIIGVANEPGYQILYPYAASDLDTFSRWSKAKQYCSEYYRAIEIKSLLDRSEIPGVEDWSKRNIILFARAHGFTPLSSFRSNFSSSSHKTLPSGKEPGDETFYTRTEFIPYKELLAFRKKRRRRLDEDKYVEVDGDEDDSRNGPNTSKYGLLAEGDFLKKYDHLKIPCRFVRETAEQMGISLQAEEVFPNVRLPLPAMAVLLASKCLMEELVRRARAVAVLSNGMSDNVCREVTFGDVLEALLQRPEFDILLNVGLGKNESEG